MTGAARRRSRACDMRAPRRSPRGGGPASLAARLVRIVAPALLLAAPAAAQAPDWRAAAPVLPLSGEIRPLRAPVAIGGAAWGPWRRLCREQTLRPGRPPQRDCLTVADVVEEGGGARLVLVQDGIGLRIGARRTTDGRVTDFAALRPDGAPAAAEPGRDAVLGAWRTQFASLSLPARRVAPAEDFSLPVEGAPRGMACRPEGLSAIGSRAVLVARCAVELAGRLRGGESEARVAIFARVAVDVAAGMVVAQGYATRIETFGAGGRSNGVVVTPSRVVLE